MSKRPRCAALSIPPNAKRPCVRPLATSDTTEPQKCTDDKRKSVGFTMGAAPKKVTVPQPFNLSSRSSWRQTQARRKTEQQEAKRKTAETFRPRINEPRINEPRINEPTKRPTAPTSAPARKRQVREDLLHKHDKENAPAHGFVVPHSTKDGAQGERQPLGSLTNTDNGQSNVVIYGPLAKQGPPKADVPAPVDCSARAEPTPHTTSQEHPPSSMEVPPGGPHATLASNKGDKPVTGKPLPCGKTNPPASARLSMTTARRPQTRLSMAAPPQPSARLSAAAKSTVPLTARPTAAAKPALGQRPATARLSMAAKSAPVRPAAAPRVNLNVKARVDCRRPRVSVAGRPGAAAKPVARAGPPAKGPAGPEAGDQAAIGHRTRARVVVAEPAAVNPLAPQRPAAAQWESRIKRRATAGPTALPKVVKVDHLPAFVPPASGLASRGTGLPTAPTDPVVPACAQPAGAVPVVNSSIPDQAAGTATSEKKMRPPAAVQEAKAETSADTSGLDRGPVAQTTGLSCFTSPDDRTQQTKRGFSAPVPSTAASASSSSGIHISDDDDDESSESGQNYGVGGYCHIQKGYKFCEDRYTAIHQLGEGKYSTVWLMHDKDGPYPEYSNFVAIKVGRAMSSSVLPEDIKQESNLLQYINQTVEPQDLRYLATMIDSFIHEGPYGLHACMVFKVLGSQLLKLVYERNEAVRQGLPLDMESVLTIFRCILRGTVGFHDRNIVHTDLKPENILLTVPDDNIIQLMKTFARESGLPPPCLEDRHQATVTPHRSAGRSVSIQTHSSTPAKRSDSVDPLDFWNNQSPHGQVPAAGPGAGRPTMAVTKGDTKGDTSSQGSNQSGDAFVAMPSISANDIVLSQSAASANLSQSSTSANECDEVHEAAGCAPLIRVDGPATPRSGSGVQHDNAGGEATDSPPTGLCLRPPPKSPFPTTAIGNVAGTPAEAILHTPQFESPRVNPCTPQYVLDQGKGTEVLLGDFGLAMVLEHKHELAPPGVNIYPQDYVVMNHNHGMVLQTREYRAPEVLLGQDFNVKIDVYSIACIIVELITGDYLWDPKNTVPARYCYTESEIDKEHFQHMIAVVGTDAFTKLKARRTFYRTKYFSACGEPKIDSRRRREPKSRPISSILSPHVPETMLTDLSHLLTKMLEFHPNDRWSASQCLDFLDQPAFHVLEDDFLHA